MNETHSGISRSMSATRAHNAPEDTGTNRLEPTPLVWLADSSRRADFLRGSCMRAGRSFLFSVLLMF